MEEKLSAAGGPAEAQQKKPQSSRQSAYEWLESVVSAIAVCILIFIFFFRIVNVDGTSMVPTLQDFD